MAAVREFSDIGARSLDAAAAALGALLGGITDKQISARRAVASG
jgi:hypothetical protein